MFAAALFLVGTIDHSRGLLIPQFRETFDMSASQIGMLFSFTSILYVAGVYGVGRLISKISYKPNLIMGIVIPIIGFFLLYQFHVKFAFILGMCLITFATAQLSILVNISVPKLQISKHTVIINMMHFMYGISATITQKIVGYLLDHGMRYYDIYFYLLFFFLLFLPLAFLVKFEETGLNQLQKNTIYDVDDILNQMEAPKEATIPEVITKYSPKKEKILTVVFIMVMGLYIAGEAQTATWFYTYIVDRFAKSPTDATNFTSAFFLTLTFGRLFGGFIVEKIGHMKSVLASFLFAFFLYFAGIALGESGLFLIGISGVFFSIIYPTLILSYGRYFKDAARATSIIIAGASAVNMVANSVMGVLNDVIGVSYAMYFIPLCLGVAIVLMLYVRKSYGYKI